MTMMGVQTAAALAARRRQDSALIDRNSAIAMLRTLSGTRDEYALSAPKPLPPAPRVNVSTINPRMNEPAGYYQPDPDPLAGMLSQDEARSQSIEQRRHGDAVVDQQMEAMLKRTTAALTVKHWELANALVEPIDGESEHEFLTRRYTFLNELRTDDGLDPLPMPLGRYGRTGTGEPVGTELGKVADAGRKNAAMSDFLARSMLGGPVPDRSIVGEGLAGAGPVGTIHTMRSLAGAADWAGRQLDRLTGPSAVGSTLREGADVVRQFSDRAAGTVPAFQRSGKPGEGDGMRGFVGDVGEGVNQMVQAAGVGSMLQGPGAVVAFAGTAAAPVVGSQYDEAYRAMIDQGVDEQTAATIADKEAAIAGAVSVLTNLPVGELLLKRTPMGKTIMRDVAESILDRMAVTAVAEGSQEFTEAVGSEFARVLSRPEYKGFGPAFLKDAGYDALVGAAVGGLSGGVGGGSRRAKGTAPEEPDVELLAKVEEAAKAIEALGGDEAAVQAIRDAAASVGATEAARTLHADSTATGTAAAESAPPEAAEPTDEKIVRIEALEREIAETEAQAEAERAARRAASEAAEQDTIETLRRRGEQTKPPEAPARSIVDMTAEDLQAHIEKSIAEQIAAEDSAIEADVAERSPAESAGSMRAVRGQFVMPGLERDVRLAQEAEATAKRLSDSVPEFGYDRALEIAAAYNAEFRRAYRAPQIQKPEAGADASGLEDVAETNSRLIYEARENAKERALTAIAPLLQVPEWSTAEGRRLQDAAEEILDILRDPPPSVAILERRAFRQAGIETAAKAREDRRATGPQFTADRVKAEFQSFDPLKFTDFQGKMYEAFAKDISTRNPYGTLYGLVVEGYSQNRTSRAVFTKLTGVKLGSSRKEAESRFDEWAGLRRGERAGRTAAIKRQNEEAAAKMQNEAVARIDAKRAKEAGAAAAAGNIKLASGDVVSMKAYIDGSIADGFDVLARVGEGKVRKWYLVHPDGGVSKQMQGRAMVEYAKVRARVTVSNARTLSEVAGLVAMHDKAAADQSTMEQIRDQQGIELDAEMRKFADDWRDATKDKLYSGIDPELLVLASRGIALLVKKGVRTFDDMIRAMARLLPDHVRRMARYLERGWDAVRSLDGSLGPTGSTVEVLEGLQLPDASPDAKAVADPSVGSDRSVAGEQPVVPGVRPPQGDAVPDGGAPAVDGDGRAGADGSAGGVPGVGESLDRPDGKAAGRRGRGGRGARAGDARTDGDAGRADRAESEAGSRDTADAGQVVGVSPPSVVPDAAKLNHRIEPADVVVAPGEVGKVEGNIAALRLLKKLETEDRQATSAEKKVLARFVGWGALQHYLDTYKATLVADFAARGRSLDEREGLAEWEKKYGARHREIASLMSADEIDAAKRSTLNAHYTSRDIIERGLWGAAERLGFAGGRALENSAGIGHVIGMQPGALADRTGWIAVELDKLSSRLLKKLYPQATVFGQGFETVRLAQGTMDLVIGNVPFHSEGPRDSRYPRLSLHNYFLARSIDVAKPGGLVIEITSTSTMDNEVSREFRAWAAERADLVGAIRLPNNAFKANAGTEVTTDMLIFRKKDGSGFVGEEFLNTLPVPSAGSVSGTAPDTVDVNEYFKRHPEMILGEMGYFSTLYTNDEPGVRAFKGRDLNQQIEAAIKTLPANIAAAGGDPSFKPIVGENVSGAKLGAFVAYEGGLGVVQLKEGLEARRGHAVPVEATEIVPIDAKNDARRRGLAFIELRDTLRELVNEQVKLDANESRMEMLRASLNRLYEKATQIGGGFHSLNELAFRRFRDDPEYGLLAALEVPTIESYVDEKGVKQARQVYKRAEIMQRRNTYPSAPPDKISSVVEGLALAQVWTGRINTAWIAQRMGMSEEAVVAAAVESGEVFIDPVTSTLVAADEYLSGNVKDKLKRAKAEQEAGDERFARNVEALTAVQPKDRTIGEIRFRLGANWVPPEAVEAWLGSLYQMARPFKVEYLPALGEFTMSEYAKVSASRDFELGTQAVPASRLISLALDLRSPMVKKVVGVKENGDPIYETDREATQLARAKQSELRDAFYRWASSHSEWGPTLAAVYNEKINTTIRRKWFTPPESFKYPGATDSITLRSNQRSAVYRSLRESMVLGHAVGTGKTYAFITAVMESRRLGLATKPMIAALNANYDAIVADFRRLYPTARILAPTEADFKPENRRRLVGRMATGDYDCIIVAHSQIGLIPDNFERVRAYIKAEIDSLESAIREKKAAQNNSRGGRGGGRSKDPSVKALEGAKKKLEERMAKLLDRPTDQVLDFDQVGIDMIVVDEAHMFKKLGFVTRAEAVRGLDTTRSERAQSLFLKIGAVQQRTGGRGIILATGTPVTNTVAELYTMMRMSDEAKLRRLGIHTFDDFLTAYCDSNTAAELNAAGHMKNITRLTRFINAQDLQNIWMQFGDVVQADDIPGIKRPNIVGGKPTVMALPPTEQVRGYMRYLLNWYRTWDAKPGREKALEPHIPLVIDGLGKKAALDMRLIDPQAPADPNSKASIAVRGIFERWKNGTADRTTQVVFADLYQSPKTAAKPGDALDVEDIYTDIDKDSVAANDDDPATDATDEQADEPVGRFNLYRSMKADLVRLGIPEDEIAIIHDYIGGSKAKRQRRAALFEAMNEGRVRVLFGSTQRLGIGVNVQQRLKTLWHLDAPPRPSDVEQREGRILRHGNLNEEIEIIQMGVLRTYDAGAFERLARKQKMINQVVSGRFAGNEFEDAADGAAMSFAEAASVISGNPLYKRLFEIETRVREFELQWSGHITEKATANRRLGIMRASVMEEQSRVDMLTRALAAVDPRWDLPESEWRILSVPGQGKPGDVIPREQLEDMIQQAMNTFSEEEGAARLAVPNYGTTQRPIVTVNINGTAYDLSLTAMPDPITGALRSIRGHYTVKSGSGRDGDFSSGRGLFVSLRRANSMESAKGWLQKAEQELAEAKAHVQSFERSANATFEHEEDLAQARAEAAATKVLLESDPDAEAQMSEEQVKERRGLRERLLAALPAEKRAALEKLEREALAILEAPATRPPPPTAPGARGGFARRPREFSPEFVGKLVRIGLLYAEAGARTFGSFARTMIGQFGPSVRAVVQQVYEGVRQAATAKGRPWVAEMTPPDQVSLEAVKGSEGDPQVMASLTGLMGTPAAGRPELANPGITGSERQAVDVLDSMRERLGIPDRRPDTEVQAEANRRLADGETEIRRLLRVAEAGGQLGDVDTVVARGLVVRGMNRLLKGLTTPGANTIAFEAVRVFDAYRRTGTEQARAFRQRRDSMMSHADRMGEALSHAMFEPTPQQRDRLAALEKEIGDLRDQLDLAQQRARQALAATQRAEEVAGQPRPAAPAPAPARPPETEVSAPVKDNGEQIAFAAEPIELPQKGQAAKPRKPGPAAGDSGLPTPEGSPTSNADLPARAEARAPRARKLKSDIERAEAKRKRILDRIAEQAIAAAKALRKAGIEPEDLVDPTFLADRRKVARAYRIISAARATPWGMFQEYWINSILSGVKTQVANASSAVYGAYDVFGVRLAQAILTLPLPIEDKPRLGEFAPMMKAIAPAVTRAARNFLLSWDTELPSFEADIINARGDAARMGDLATKLEHGNRGPKISGTLGRVVRVPTRLMLAVDEFLKTFFGLVHLAGLAQRRGIEEGLKGDQLGRFVAEQLLDPHADIWDDALSEAKRITFQSEVGAFGKAALQLRAKIPPLFLVVPFVVTPINIFKVGLEISPLGALKTMWKSLRAGSSALGLDRTGFVYTGAQFSRDVTQNILSGILTWALLGLVFDDDEPIITGTAPADASDRALFYASGKRPLSIRIGDRWISYARIEPFSVGLATTIDLMTAAKRAGNGEDAVTAFARAAQTLRRQVEDKTFLSGIGDLIQVFESDRKDFGEAARFAQRLSVSMVPNLIRQPMSAVDPLVRETRIWGEPGAAFWHRAGDRLVQQALPWPDDKPFPKRDLFGRAVEKGGGPGSDVLWRAMSPVEVFRDSLDPAEADIRRVSLAVMNWNLAHPTEQIRFTTPLPYFQRTVRGERQTIYMTDAEYDRLMVESGREIGSRIRLLRLDPSNPQAGQMERLERIVSTARTAARDRILRARQSGRAG